MASILDEIRAEVETELSQQPQEEKPTSVLEDVKQEVAAEPQQAPIEEPKGDFFESAERWLEPAPTQKSSGDIFLGLISNKRSNELDDEDKGLFNALSDEEQYKVAQARKDISLDDAQARRIFEIEKSKMPSVPTSWEDWYNLGGDAFDVVKNVAKLGVKVPLGAAEFGRDVVKATDMTVSDEEFYKNLKKAKSSFYSFMAPAFEIPESVAWATQKASEGGFGWADAAGEKLGLVNPEDRFERWKGRRLVSQAQAEYFREHPTVYSRMLDNPLAKDALSYIAKSQMESPEELAARNNISVEEAKAQQDAMSREQIDNLTSDMESELPEENARVRIAGEFLLPGELGMGTMGAVSAVAKAGTGVAKGLKYIGKSADEIAEINKAAQALRKSQFAEMLKKRTERAEAVAQGAGKIEKAIEGWKPAAEKVNKVFGNITAPVLGGVAGYSVSQESPTTGILTGILGGAATRGLLKGTKVGLEIPTLVREVAEARKVAPLGKTFETLGKSAEGSALKAKILSRGGKTIDNILSNSVEYAKTGIHGTTLALATGALESADPEEMKQMLADGLAITLGGRALQHIKGKMMGNDPIIEQRERISDDSRIHRRYQEADPETQANLDQISDFDNAIAAKQRKLDESESDLANLMVTYKGSAEDAQKIKLAQSEVEKNKIALDQVKRANVQTRNEFGREFLKTYANLQDITNGVLKTGQNNVGFNILSTDQIYQKLRNDPANNNVPDADLAQMASQAGFYSNPAQQGLVFDRRKPSIVINADSIRERINLFGESPTEALNHETSHFIDLVPEFQSALSPVRSMLFQNEIRDAAGNIKATTPGIFSKAKLVELFNDGYLRHLDPQGKEAFSKLNKLWDESRGQLDENKVANYMKSELMADLLGEVSSRHLSKDLDSATLAMWDRARIKAKKNLLDRAIDRFYGFGGRGDIVTAANTRAEFPPEAMAAARDAMRQIVALNGEISPPVQEPDMPAISKAQMMKNSALLNRFGKDSPLFKSEFKVKVFDKDGNQIGESMPVTTPNPREGTFQNTDVGMRKLSGYGDIPVEAQGLQVPEGGTLVVSRDLVMQPDGVTPVMYDAKEAKKVAAERKKLITEALDTDDYGTPNRFEPVAEGSETYRGTFTPAQIKAIQDMPESLVPKTLKENMLKINEAIARGDGTRFIVDYAAVMNDNGKYQAFSPKMYDLVPIGMHLSKAGNFLVTTISVGRIFDKMRLWNERMPGRLRFWDNNLERTFDDFSKYLNNWQQGKAGETGLDADPQVALQKKNIFNDLLSLYDSATEFTNLDRTTIPRRKGDPRGKDANRTIMSIRVDHIAELLANENATKLPVNYGFAKINFMPERMEGEVPRQEELQFMPERPVDQMAAEQGFNVKAYHGTSRADRVGNRFRKTRATSGPMAFFTSDPNIAENYSKGKADTSIEPPEDYRDWFKVKPAGSKKEVNISDVWYSLTPEQKRIATERLYTTGYEDADQGTGKIIPNAEYSIAGKDSIDYELRKARGNALEAAKEIWLTSGTLYNSEIEFKDVLKSLGVDARFDDPFAKNPKVYDVFLKIQNPLVTSEIPENVIDALRANAKKQRKPTRQFGADAWDKRTVDAKDWIAELDADYAAGKNSFAWTRIPDWVTETLKTFGYDSIQDTGGKMGGEGHDVYIPFEENQIKSAAQETFTDAGKKIPMEKRFSEKPDIRFMPERPADQERIVSATYTDPRTGEVREGVNHKAANPNAPDEQTDRESRYYGFKTDTGRVVDREEAYRIAEESGQLKEATSKEDKFNADRGVLHSNMVEMEPTIGEKTEISPKIGEPIISEKQKSSEMIDSDYMKAVESNDVEAQQKLVDEATKAAGFTSFNEDYPTYASLIEGVRNGQLLVHSRRIEKSEIPDLQYGLDPTFGETLKSTEAAMAAEEMGIEPAELVFAADNFKWAGDGRNGMIFVSKNGFQKSLGDGRVELADGKIVRYENSPIADYENDALRGEPFGVETNDWYSNKVAEVVGVSPFNEKSADPVTYDDAGNVIPLSQRFNPKTSDIRFMPERPQDETIKPADIETSAKPATDAVIKPYSNALVSSAGLINFLPAYHGTPYDVDKFKLANIGTGEGAQAYGWGLYFAQARSIGERYRKELSGYDELTIVTDKGKKKGQQLDDLDMEAAKYLESGARDAGQFKHNTVYYAKQAAERSGRKDVIERLDEYGRDARVTYEKNLGNLYKVDLDVKEEDLLDWDSPLSEQSEIVRDALTSIVKKRVPKEIYDVFLNDVETDGRSLYALISDSFGESAQGTPEKRASEALLAAGIPGIRYFDEKSRLFGEGTRNYVVFDENLIKILDKNDKPVEGDLPKQAQPSGLQFMPARKEKPAKKELEKEYITIDAGDSETVPVLQEIRNGKPLTDPKGDAKFAQQKYDLLSSPFIDNYSENNPEDTTKPNYKELAYDVSGVAQKKINSAIDSGAVDAAANIMVNKTNEAMKNADIAAGSGWYSRMRENLLNALGVEGRELLSQLLGATSAKTPVNENFLQAMDGYEGIKSGRYDSNRKAYLEMINAEKKNELNDLIDNRNYIAVIKNKISTLNKAAKKVTGKKQKEIESESKKLKELIAIKPEDRTKKNRFSIVINASGLMPLRSNGKKFNANSMAVMKVIAGTWLDNRKAPKTPNFAGNLSGRTVQATIDVWAARFLRQILHEGFGKPWRIQPKSETGVSNEDFALGQVIMQRAAKKLGMNPDDLQAILWFAEKHNWDNNGWTGAEGAEKSSFDEIFSVFFPKGKKPLTFSEASEVLKSQKNKDESIDQKEDEETYEDIDEE
jgi:hypothetical protein